VAVQRGVRDGLSAGGVRPSVTAGSSSPTANGREPTARKVATADVLEALHYASGLPIVADFYTRLYDPATVFFQNQPLFAALNHLADPMRLRWSKDSGAGEAGHPQSGSIWLEFRSLSFYDDRLKEVPNRLLSRWAASRREHGTLTLDDLCEIVQLPDAQLDAEEMAEGARQLWGLKEWDLGRNKLLRSHLRFLATLTPDQRHATMRTEGLAFERMSLSQQQQYIALGERDWIEPLQSLEELAGGVLRVEYTQPGWFEWRVPGHPYFQWIVPIGTGSQLRRATRPQIRERTPEAALEKARRLYPQGFEAEVQTAKQFDARFEAAAMEPQADQIVPTGLDLTIIYVLGASIKRAIHWISPVTDDCWPSYWSYGTYWPVPPFPPPPSL
jgi:hypothetical protein